MNRTDQPSTTGARMTKQTEPRPGAGLVLLGIFILWCWLTFTYCPPLFWIVLGGAFLGLLGSGGGGGGSDRNCGPGGPDAY